MSLRDHVSNILDNLIASVIYSGALLAAVRFRPWAGSTLRASRNAVVRAVATVFALPGLLRRLAGSLSANAAPEPLPPGTSSAIAMAMQPPPERPRFNQTPHFVNNSNWAQWEAAEHQNNLAAHFAMRTTMRGTLNALN